MPSSVQQQNTFDTLQPSSASHIASAKQASTLHTRAALDLDTAMMGLTEPSKAAIKRLSAALKSQAPRPGQFDGVSHKAQAAVAVLLFEAPSLHSSLPTKAKPWPSRGSNAAQASQPELHCIMTTRALHLSSHPGQASLPGGKCDRTDVSVEMTALRECYEEIGLPLEPSVGAVIGTSAPFISKTTLLVHPTYMLLNAANAEATLASLKAAPSEVSAIWSFPIRALLSSTAPQGMTLRPSDQVDRHRPPQQHFRSYSDVSWKLCHTYRLHRFRTSHELIKGLTADILLHAASLLYEPPRFAVYAPAQLSWDKCVETLLARHAANVGKAERRWGDGESGDKQGSSTLFNTVNGVDYKQGEPLEDAKLVRRER